MHLQLIAEKGDLQNLLTAEKRNEMLTDSWENAETLTDWFSPLSPTQTLSTGHFWFPSVRHGYNIFFPPKNLSCTLRASSNFHSAELAQVMKQQNASLEVYFLFTVVLCLTRSEQPGTTEGKHEAEVEEFVKQQRNPERWRKLVQNNSEARRNSECRTFHRHRTRHLFFYLLSEIWKALEGDDFKPKVTLKTLPF